MSAVHCFGISNHSPDQVLQFLKRAKFITSDLEVSVPARNVQIKKLLKRKFIFFLDIGDFKRNVTRLNTFGEKVTVFVFASPIKLDELSGICKLDSVAGAGFKKHGYVMSKFDVALMRKHLKMPAPRIMKSHSDFLKSMISNVIKGSLLNPLMSFLYTLPSATHQTPVKLAVVNWIVSNSPISKLDSCLDVLDTIIISPKAREKLKLILSTDTCTKFKHAAHEYQKTNRDEKHLEQICAKYDVDPYEIRYLFSVLAAANSSKKGRSATKKTRRTENGDKSKQRAH